MRVGRVAGRLRLRGSTVRRPLREYRLRPDKIGIVLEGRNRKTLYETSIATVVRKDSTGERNTFLTYD